MIGDQVGSDRIMRALLALTISVAFLTTAHAAPSSEKQAKAHAKQGAALFANGRYADAYQEFLAAYQLVPKPALLYNIARASHEAGDKPTALDYYRRYLAGAPDGEAADEAREYVASLEKELETAPPDDPKQERDGPAVDENVRSDRNERADAGGFRPGVTLLGGRAGLGATVNSSKRFGEVVGAFAAYSFRPWLALQGELVWARKGTYWTDGSNYEFFDLGILELPVGARLTLSRGRFGLLVGGFLGLVATKRGVYGEDASVVTTVDAGAIAGASYRHDLARGALVFDLRYEQGLMSVRRDDGPVRTTTVSLSIGYSFF